MFPASEQVTHMAAAQGKHACAKQALVSQHQLRTQLSAAVESQLSAPLLKSAAVPPAVATIHTGGCAAPRSSIPLLHACCVCVCAGD
jgi:hypothetical protein